MFTENMYVSRYIYLCKHHWTKVQENDIIVKLKINVIVGLKVAPSFMSVEAVLCREQFASLGHTFVHISIIILPGGYL